MFIFILCIGDSDPVKKISSCPFLFPLPFWKLSRIFWHLLFIGYCLKLAFLLSRQWSSFLIFRGFPTIQKSKLSWFGFEGRRRLELLLNISLAPVILLCSLLDVDCGKSHPIYRNRLFDRFFILLHCCFWSNSWALRSWAT